MGRCMRMKLRWQGILGTGLALAALTGAQAQIKTHTVTLDGASVQGQPYSLDELGAVVAHMDGEFKVLFVMEPQARLEAYRSVDLRADDRLRMINGKTITSLDMLRAVIDSTAVGTDIQLGIKRDKDMMIVRYPKADPKSLPQIKRMVVTDTLGGEQMAGGSFTHAGGPPEEVAVLRGAGVIVRQGDSCLEVMMLMPKAAEIEALAGLQPGDRVESLQGQVTGDLDALESAWKGIATGDSVRLVCSRDGQSHTYEFAKPDASKDPGGAVMITK